MSRKLDDAKKAIIKQLDCNKDGKVDIQDVINLAIRTPGVHIDRTKFLKKELYKNHTQEEIDEAINKTPAAAGIPGAEIDRIADDVIVFERNCVSGISTALGAPGGVAMVATVPADIVQYYGYTLRATQKLLYLYGFPEIQIGNNGLELDTQTMNQIILCLGIMNGVAGTNNAIKAMAKAFAVGVHKKIINTALTKGTIYPIIKQVAKWFGIKITKTLLADSLDHFIPIVGGVVAGGITFLSFKPCCYRLKDVLKDTRLSNPDHKETEEENQMYKDFVDAEIVDIHEESEQ